MNETVSIVISRKKADLAFEALLRKDVRQAVKATASLEEGSAFVELVNTIGRAVDRPPKQPKHPDGFWYGDQADF